MGDDDADRIRIVKLESEIGTIKRDLQSIRKGVDGIDAKLERYVPMTRYQITERAMMAIYATLAFAAFGLLWDLIKSAS